MTFEDVKKTIFPVPKDVVKPVPYWQHRSYRTTNSVAYWDEVDCTPRGSYGEMYEMAECKEHRCTEAVPHQNYYAGFLLVWYNAGLHPRFPIWTTVRKHYPNCRRTWLERLARPPEDMGSLLRKYRDDPKGFADAAMAVIKGWQPVTLTAGGGQRFRVTRQFRDRFRKADFTVDEFIATTNQQDRRLMLLSRSFEVTDVLSSLVCLAKDKEGEIYGEQDLNGWQTWRSQQHYLHVVCATTGEHYLLGIPTRIQCKTCSIAPPHRPTAGSESHEVKWQLAWKPAAARRWTFGLDEDAVFVQEA